MAKHTIVIEAMHPVRQVIKEYDQYQWNSMSMETFIKEQDYRIWRQIQAGDIHLEGTTEYHWSIKGTDKGLYIETAQRYSQEEISQYLVDYVYAGIGFIGERYGVLYYNFDDDLKGRGLVAVGTLGGEGSGFRRFEYKTENEWRSNDNEEDN